LPGRGRNLAIARAANDWIASIDAGNRPQPDWLEQLIATAESDLTAEVVFGVAEPLTDTYFTECAAIILVPNGRLSRSIASSLFRRSAWSKAGCFREDLRSGEDLLFFKGLEAAGVLTTRCAAAVVLWELQRTLADSFRRFALYSRNGMKAGLFKEWQFNVARLYFLLLIFLLAALLFWPLIFLPPAILLLRAERRIRNWYRIKSPERVWRELLSPRRVLTVMTINFVIDLAALFGACQWVLRDRVGRQLETTHSGSLG